MARNAREPVRSLDEPTRSMLAGLSTLHELTIALDARGELRWIDDRLDLLSGHAAELLGRPARDLRDALSGSDDERRRLRAGELDEILTATDPASNARIETGLVAEPLELCSFDTIDATGSRLRVVVGRRARGTNGDRLALESRIEELQTSLHSISHDLRSPLVSVLGFTRLLRDEFGDPIGRTGLHFLDRIEQAGRNMERLLKDMLELSRLDQAPYCPVHVSPDRVLRQLEAELKLQLEERAIELQLPDDPPIVLCDRTQLYQLFSNLIGNAIRHMEVDTGGRIQVSVESVEGGWEIAVEDSGPGIAPEDAQRIFEAFQTARKPGQPKQSSGLGLAIVKKIVQAHHGRVWVESEPGSGARFVVWLPGS